ncbi:MAG: MFS transporter [Chloroflexi bacterium]|nr:MFS transporter [Chloroflexota bacterium]
MPKKVQMMRDEETSPYGEPTAQPAGPRRSRIFYGWYLVAAAALISAAVAGVNDSSRVLMLPISQDLGLSLFALAGSFSIGVLTNGLTQPVLGHLFDRWDSRKVILISVAVAGLATLGLGLTSSYWHFILLYSVIFSAALGGASFGLLGPLVARWFLKRRALALSLLMAISAMGGIFSPPIAGLALAFYSWRETLMVSGAILLLLALPLAWKFLRNWPSEIGLKPDGDPETPTETRMRGSAPTNQRGRFEVERSWRAFRSRPIWALVPVFAIGGVADIFASIILPSFAVNSLNLGPETIAVSYGVMGVLGPVGAVAVGLVADRFARKRILGALLLAQGLAFLVLIAVPFGFSLLLFAVLAGLSGTTWMLIALLLIADIYGLRALATLWGIAFLFHSIGSFIGSLSFGLVIDLTGSYNLHFAACALMLVLAAIVSFAINEGKYSARYQAAVELEAVGD